MYIYVYNSLKTNEERGKGAGKLFKQQKVPPGSNVWVCYEEKLLQIQKTKEKKSVNGERGVKECGV